MVSKPVRAEDLLPGDQTNAEVNGVSVRKGTIGAFLTNVRSLDGLAEGSPERVAVENELRSSVPLLRSIGLFEVFRLRDTRLADVLGVDD